MAFVSMHSVGALLLRFYFAMSSRQYHLHDHEMKDRHHDHYDGIMILLHSSGVFIVFVDVVPFDPWPASMKTTHITLLRIIIIIVVIIISLS